MDGKYTKKIGLLAILPLLLLFPFGMQQANAVDTTATVTIVGACGVTVVTPPGFGSLQEGNISPVDVLLDLTKTGVTPSDLKISGSGWAGGSPATTMPVGQTHYLPTNGATEIAYASMTALTGSLVVVYAAGTFDVAGDDIDEKLQVALANTASTGLLSQTQTVTVTC